MSLPCKINPLGVYRLPAGYLSALFLGSNENTPVSLPGSYDKTCGAKIDCIMTGTSNANNCQITSSTPSSEGYWYIFPPRRDSGSSSKFAGYWFKKSYSFSGKTTERSIASVNFCNDKKMKLTQNGVTQATTLVEGLDYIGNGMLLIVGWFSGNIYKVAVSRGAAIERDFVMAIDPQGVPCLWDRVTKQPFYSEGRRSFIVGMTVAQARALGKLPADATTKTLTVSLPASIVDGETVTDAAVQAALDAAASKGWDITIQTYTE